MLFEGGWEEATTPAPDAPPKSHGKKRKRAGSSAAAESVDVSKLMDQIDKQLAHTKDRPAKKDKKHKPDDSAPPPPKKQQQQKPDKKEKGKDKKKLQPVAVAEKPKPKPKPAAVSQPEDASGTLTSLQSNMKSKLDGARFRWINEVLYKSDSAEATSMLQADPKIFDEYHAGFRRQVESWPTNPVDIYIAQCSKLPAKSVVADLGCGEAALARALVPKGYTVLSFDLVSQNPWIVPADVCTHIPLPGSEDPEQDANAAVVDVCVCALSLMNSNWVQCLREARRVLKPKGLLKVAEVTSRFEDVDKFVSIVEAIGFKLLNKDDPSTHFTLFEFRKVSQAAPSEKAWKKLLGQHTVLQPCEYKRR